MMNRKRSKYWGEMESQPDHELKMVKMSTSKIAQLQEVIEKNSSSEGNQESSQLYKKLFIKNALVSQAVEVNQQTEMISSLLDTYSNNKFNFQLIPTIDFPPSNSALIDKDKAFQKPIWFIKPTESDFNKGIPKDYGSRITKTTVNEILKKSICGLMKMSGFSEANSSALTTYVDAVDQFYKYFMEQVRQAVNEQTSDTNVEVDVLSLEKAYFSMTGNSLTSLHNHFKNDIFVRNRQEIAQYKESMNEYNKLLQENNLKDYMSFLDPASNGQSDRMNFLDQDSGAVGLKDILDG